MMSKVYRQHRTKSPARASGSARARFAQSQVSLGRDCVDVYTYLLAIMLALTLL